MRRSRGLGDVYKRQGFALTSKANLLAVNDAGRDAHGDIAGAMNRAGTVAVLARVRDAAAGAIAILAGGGKAEGAAVFRGKTGATAGTTGRGLARGGTRAMARGTRRIAAQCQRDGGSLGGLCLLYTSDAADEATIV